MCGYNMMRRFRCKICGKWYWVTDMAPTIPDTCWICEFELEAFKLDRDMR